VSLKRLWWPFVDLINSRGCTNVWKLLNLSDLQKIANAFFKNAILSRKIVPQGAFGQIKLHFESEKRPARVFLADKIVF